MEPGEIIAVILFIVMIAVIFIAFKIYRREIK